MSHVAAIKFCVKDLHALERACESMGLKFNWNQKTHNWFGKFMNDYNSNDAAFKNGIPVERYGKCDHAISLPDRPGAYEVGVFWVEEVQGYMLALDFWSGGGGMVGAVGGNNCEKLIQAYRAEVIRSNDGIQNLVSSNCQEHVVTSASGDMFMIYDDDQTVTDEQLQLEYCKV